MIQRELDNREGFHVWWSAQQDIMRSDQLLRKFKEGRDLVVHKKTLDMSSTAFAGLFEFRKLRLASGMPAPVDVYSSDILDWIRKEQLLPYVSEQDRAVGEELGIQRTWKAKELGDGELLGLCDSAFIKIAQIVANAHKFCGFSFPTPDQHYHDPAKVNVLTESDVDPTLPKKWGWI